MTDTNTTVTIGEWTVRYDNYCYVATDGHGHNVEMYRGDDDVTFCASKSEEGRGYMSGCPSDRHVPAAVIEALIAMWRAGQEASTSAWRDEAPTPAEVAAHAAQHPSGELDWRGTIVASGMWMCLDPNHTVPECMRIGYIHGGNPAYLTDRIDLLCVGGDWISVDPARWRPCAPDGTPVTWPV